MIQKRKNTLTNHSTFPKFLTLSWEDFQTDVFDLSQKIEKSEEKFDLIIAIARGGLSIAQCLSDFLQLPITSFTISGYKDLKQQKIPEITFKIGTKLHNKKILLVDDVSDTGKTFIRGIAYLKKLGAAEVKTAAFFSKPWATFIPDYYVGETESWVIFPFEMRETVEALIKKFKKENLSDTEIEAKLIETKMPEKFVNRYKHVILKSIK